VTFQAGFTLAAGILIAGLIAYGIRQYLRDDPWDELDEISHDEEDPKA
jgi:hypothetical protein